MGPVSGTEGSIVIERNGVRLDVQPLEGLDVHAQITDQFGVDLNEGEPEAYHVTMPPQYHMAWRTTKSQTEHHIKVQMKITEI